MEKRNSKPSLEENLFSTFSKKNNLQSLVDDYEETAPDLISAYNICVLYTDMSELDEKQQAAIQTLWFFIEAIIQAGYEAKNGKN